MSLSSNSTHKFVCVLIAGARVIEIFPRSSSFALLGLLRCVRPHSHRPCLPQLFRLLLTGRHCKIMRTFCPPAHKTYLHTLSSLLILEPTQIKSRALPKAPMMRFWSTGLIWAFWLLSVITATPSNARPKPPTKGVRVLTLVFRFFRSHY